MKMTPLHRMDTDWQGIDTVRECLSRVRAAGVVCDAPASDGRDGDRLLVAIDGLLEARRKTLDIIEAMRSRR